MENPIPAVFLAQHAQIHAATTPGILNSEDRLFSQLSESQLRACPAGHNSIVWLLWHIARGEDVMVNTVVRDVPEVFDREGWQANLGVTRRDIGVGMTETDVDEFSLQVDVSALRAYRAAVARETRTGLTGRDFADLDMPIVGGGRRALASGALGPGAEWLAEALDTRGRWYVLCYEVIGHCYVHLGEAEHVAALSSDYAPLHLRRGV